MDRKSGLGGNGGGTVVDSDVPGEDEAVVGAARGPGPALYVPVIGSGPLRESTSSSGPLVPEAVLPADDAPTSPSHAPWASTSHSPSAAESSAVSASDSSAVVGVELTVSGQPVPEFVAGSAHLVQMVAGQFPLGTLGEQALGETVGAAQALVQAAQSLLVMATSEAITRGLPGQSGHAVPDWIGTWAPLIDRPEALATARVAGIVTDRFHAPTPDSLDSPTDDNDDGDSDTIGDGGAVGRFAVLATKVADGRARVSRANIITRFVQDMTPIADAASLDAITAAMTDNVGALGIRDLGSAVAKAKELLVEPDDDEANDDKDAARRLFRRVGTVAGLAEWQLLLDAEAEAILKAALDPLSAPRPGADEHGVKQLDARTAATRRADALMEIIGRGVAAPQGQTQTEKAKIFVTISYQALQGQVCGGGASGDGQQLSAGTVRRLACDAQILPIVLGGPSEVLDVGVTKRLFTPAQRAAVYLRDRGCTFPGCSLPATWCDIHHIVHWVFGGKTDLLNAAALCQRHHTLVHRYGYTATVTATDVIWHTGNTTPGTGHISPTDATGHT